MVNFPCLNKVLHYITLHCIALRCVALRCIALHCIALHCIALHCQLTFAVVYARSSHQSVSKISILLIQETVNALLYYPFLCKCAF